MTFLRHRPLIIVKNNNNNEGTQTLLVAVVVSFITHVLATNHMIARWMYKITTTAASHGQQIAKTTYICSRSTNNNVLLSKHTLGLL